MRVQLKERANLVLRFYVISNMFRRLTAGWFTLPADHGIVADYSRLVLTKLKYPTRAVVNEP